MFSFSYSENNTIDRRRILIMTWNTSPHQTNYILTFNCSPFQYNARHENDLDDLEEIDD